MTHDYVGTFVDGDFRAFLLSVAHENNHGPSVGGLLAGNYTALDAWARCAPCSADAAETHPAVWEELAVADLAMFVLAVPLSERARMVGDLALLAAASAAAALGPARAALARAAVILRGHYATLLNCPALTAVELVDWLPEWQRPLYPNVLRAAGIRADARPTVPEWPGMPPLRGGALQKQLVEAALEPLGVPRPWGMLFDQLLPTLRNATRVSSTVDCPTTDERVQWLDGLSIGACRGAWLSLWMSPIFNDYYSELHEYNTAMFAAMLVWERNGALLCGEQFARPDHCTECARDARTAREFHDMVLVGALDVQNAFRVRIRERFPATWSSHPLIGLFHPSVAGTIHYAALGVGLPPLVLRRPCSPATPPYPCEPEWCREVFARGEAPSSGLYQLTVTTVSTALHRAWLPWECEFLGANAGQVEWSVAAVLLGMNSIPCALRDFMLDCGWHTVPVAEWSGECKVWLTALRRCPIVHNYAHILPSDWDHITKVTACTTRTMTEAPWDKEIRRRTRELPCHWGIGADGRVSRGAWDRDLMLEARVTTAQMVAGLQRTGQAETAEEYWEQRYARTPSGSSSLRKLSKAVADVDPRLETQVRPGKKTTVEALPDDYLRRTMSAPPVIAARTGTKHEPDAKNRALYADDDNAFFVTAFAAHAAEKNMDHEGMRARQSPAEVVEWLQQSVLDVPHSLWLSTDYSDYNWEHEAAALRMSDLASAAAWAAAGVGNPAVADKAAACLWAARAHHNKWFSVDFPGPLLVRALSTLFSGSRDTARHNTQLHSVYSKLGLKYARVFDSGVGMYALNMCGDDEDGHHHDWVAAYSYTAALMMMGLTLNIVKQLAGDHEFLQRRITAGGLPSRPMFAMIAQFASGNWYVDKHMWYGSIVAAISNTLWDMVTRGMPIDLARRLASESIGAQMRVPRAGENGGWRHLEWWSYRHGAGEHPLWYGTAGPRSPPPVIQSDVVPPALAPGLSSAAWVRNKLRKLNVNSATVAREYEQACRVDGYASIYTRERARAHARYAEHQWPERHTEALVSTGAPPPRMDDAEVWALIRSEPPGRRATSRQEVLSRMGLDDKLVTALGGWIPALGQLKPDILARYEEPLDPVDVPLPFRWLDPAITAWYSQTAYNTAQRGRSTLDRVARNWPSAGVVAAARTPAQPLTLIMAPNAAGKSTWAQSHAANVDFDDVVRAFTLRDTLRVLGVGGLASNAYALCGAMTDTLKMTGAMTFTCQVDPFPLIDLQTFTPQRLRLLVVEPPGALLRQRMLARGWSEIEIERRTRRWQAARTAAVRTAADLGCATRILSAFDGVDHTGWS